MATLADIRLDSDTERLAALKLRGAVYTPEILAAWMGELIHEECGILDPAIVDFGCGEGSLLKAASRVLPNSQLIGIEIDEIAVVRAKQTLPSGTILLKSDVLCPGARRDRNLAAHWRLILGGKPDAIIMNPPWGAVHELAKSDAVAAGLSLATGQFDTYDLFCELAIQILAPGGAYGFILPDSLFLPEHRRLRELLLRETTIQLIARLGEGIFPNVYRGCVVVVGRATPPAPDQLTECLRLTKRDRDGLKSGRTFASYRKTLAHRVPQARFASDPEARFDIDTTEADAPILKILALGGGWTQPLESRRGAEISKTGRVLICPRCSAARPMPKVSNALCFSCGGSLANGRFEKIIESRPARQGQWSQFIAGENVRRYSASPQKWIRTDLAGINYKSRPRRDLDRLLVRKTGVGLNAAIDRTGSYTNQVVFEYTLQRQAQYPFSYLHYVLGVLSSRVMFAFHLKRGGDIEWRSHPYVTQKTLSALPIPVPKPHTRQGRQAAAIAQAVAEHMKTGREDLRIEALVGGLYGMDLSDAAWVLEVLDEAADLEAMRTLRLPTAHQINPVVTA